MIYPNIWQVAPVLGSWYPELPALWCLGKCRVLRSSNSQCVLLNSQLSSATSPFYFATAFTCKFTIWYFSLKSPCSSKQRHMSCVLSCLFHHVSAPFIGWSPNNTCFCWIQRYKQYTSQPAGTRKKWIPSPREASPTRWGWKNQRRGWREENLAGRKHNIHNIIYPPIYIYIWYIQL